MYTDPISDYLTRVRNALKARKRSVDVPASNLKKQITEILKKNGFIDDYQIVETSNKQGSIIIKLKYYNNESVILGLERISKPGIRKYVNNKELPRVLNGLGIAIVSTSQGLMTDKEARKHGIGGEVICNIW
ncbi:MAG: 30S ribosomal protein S8 [Ignavibacteria bacterium]|jgi:small subunit ribosomal protein S8